MILDLPPTFLHDLSLSGRPFVVMHDRVYTLENADSFENGDYFRNNGESLVMQEADQVSILERGVFRNKELIERYMQWVADIKFNTKFRHNASKISNLTSFLESLKDSSIERFIMIDVFDAYNHENRGTEACGVDSSKWDTLPKITKWPSREELYSKHSTLSELVQNKDLLIKGGVCYYLRQGKKNGDGALVFKGKEFVPVKLAEVSALEKEYKSKLHERIDAKALEYYQELNGMLAMQQADISKIVENISKNNYKKSDSAIRGPIGFRKIETGLYGIFLHIKPFIMVVEGTYYAFPKVAVGTNLKTGSNTLEIKGPPRVLDKGYLHPFVWEDRAGQICYDGGERWNYLGIRFEHRYALSNPHSLARRIALALREAKMNLEAGYLNTYLTPVHNIREFTPIATTKSAATAYAVSHGISKERIIENA